MYPTYTGAVSLDADDREAIAKLYGKNPDPSVTSSEGEDGADVEPTEQKSWWRRFVSGIGRKAKSWFKKLRD